MKRILLALAFALLIAAPQGALAKSSKTTLCHVPPGNPAEAHTITVGGKAAAAHFKNHPEDCLGECPCSPPPEPCGDGSCNAEDGENCETCQADCGACATACCEVRPEGQKPNCFEDLTAAQCEADGGTSFPGAHCVFGAGGGGECGF